MMVSRSEHDCLNGGFTSSVVYRKLICAMRVCMYILYIIPHPRYPRNFLLHVKFRRGPWLSSGSYVSIYAVGDQFIEFILLNGLMIGEWLMHGFLTHQSIIPPPISDLAYASYFNE